MVFTTEGFFRSSYRKVAWVGFEPTTTEFYSGALTDWAIRPWVQLTYRWRGFSDCMKHKEDEWIIKLQRYSPLVVVNSRLRDFGWIYQSLFSKWNWLSMIYFHYNGKKLWKSFCFGCITNNGWKIYSIKAVFKAAAVIAIASPSTFILF